MEYPYFHPTWLGMANPTLTITFYSLFTPVQRLSDTEGYWAPSAPSESANRTKRGDTGESRLLRLQQRVDQSCVLCGQSNENALAPKSDVWTGTQHVICFTAATRLCNTSLNIPGQVVCTSGKVTQFSRTVMQPLFSSLTVRHSFSPSSMFKQQIEFEPRNNGWFLVRAYQVIEPIQNNVTARKNVAPRQIFADDGWDLNFPDLRWLQTRWRWWFIMCAWRCFAGDGLTTYC